MSIPIRIHPFFWILAALIGWLSTFDVLQTLIWMVIVFISVLIHEYGHALTALFFGQKSVINLVGFGGLTERTGPKLKPWQEFVIVLNGPLAGFLLFLCSDFLFMYVRDSWGEMTSYALGITAYVNLFWTIINLLPVQPLDGGKLLRILLEKLFGFKGVRFSVLSSMLLCALLGIGFFAYGLMLPGAIFFILTFENFRTWNMMRTMTEKDQDTSLWQQLYLAETAVRLNNSDEALRILDNLSRSATSGAIQIATIQLKAQILFQKHLYKEAYSLIKPVLNRISPEFRRIAHQLAFHAGETFEAIELGKKAYQDSPHYEIALVNAMCHALNREVAPAVGWLQRALDDGAPNFREILRKHEFDSIRNDPQFRSLENA